MFDSGAQVIIPDIVECEFISVANEALQQVVKAKRINNAIVPRMLDIVMNNFEDLRGRCSIAIPTAYSIRKAINFYQGIWGRPEMLKIQEWAQKKHRRPSDGPPRNADLRILAVAMDLEKMEAELVTFDNDYIVFSDRIAQDLSVSIINAYSFT